MHLRHKHKEEKEIVIIAIRNDLKLQVMQSVCEKCGIKSDAKGIALAVPIDNIIGINEY